MEIIDSKKWDDFVAGHKPVQFLQSYEWGEFQQKLGRQVFRLNADWGQALIVKYNLPFDKNYLYCPRGPILTQTNADFTWTNAEKFFEEIGDLVKKERSIFFRFEPPIISNFKFQISDLHRVADVQPSKTTILDLSFSEEELLAKMHYKTRYNIRLAKRHGVKVREGRPEEIEIFLDLLKQTAKRDKFKSHPDNYYRKLIDLQTSKNSDVPLESAGQVYKFTNLYLAEYQNQILAANIVVYFGDTATYVHGASGNTYKNLMAPHLLQWEVIRQAKDLGYKFYDFWGIDEKKWPGITRFKTGFSDEIIEYPGTFDLVFDKFWYQLYCLGKRFRNW